MGYLSISRNISHLIAGQGQTRNLSALQSHFGIFLFCPDSMACSLHVVAQTARTNRWPTDELGSITGLRTPIPKADGSTVHHCHLARSWRKHNMMQQICAPESYSSSCFTCSIAVVASRFRETWVCPAGVALRCSDTPEVCNQGDDNPLPRVQCPAKSLLHVAYVVGTNHLPKTPVGGCK